MSGGVLARMRPDLSVGAALPPGRAATSGWRQPGSLAHSRRLGDNAGMARDDSRALLRWVALMLLDGSRPSRTSVWVQAVAPGVIQAAAGAGHWAAGALALGGPARRARAVPAKAAPQI
jgi:hypothetical protein